MTGPGPLVVTVVAPGQERMVVTGTCTEQAPFLAVIATQEEPPDDGGSQSAVGVLRVGRGERSVPVEFDVDDGAVPGVPRTRRSPWRCGTSTARSTPRSFLSLRPSFRGHPAGLP